MKVVLSEAARVDLASQSRWYFQRAGAEVAERYLAAFEVTISLLAMQPGMGTLRRFRDPRLKCLRSRVMFGAFRVHLVFYRAEADGMYVFRVLHGMRDLPRRLLES